MAETRGALAHVLCPPSLPGIERLLFSTVVITGYSDPTTETLDQDTAAAWLRERATSTLGVKQLQRHHHVAVVLAVTDGWSLDTSDSGCLTLYFHRYAPAEAMHEVGDYWKIDIIERE
jgi:hypothetical protein